MAGYVKDWYSPSEITFRSEHIEWIVIHYSVLDDGYWPEKLSGYIDNPFVPKTMRTGAHAYFEMPALVIGEFHWRIDQCGKDGDTFLLGRCLQIDEKRLCRMRNISFDALGRIYLDVKSYIKGRRKARPYQAFIRRKGATFYI